MIASIIDSSNQNLLIDDVMWFWWINHIQHNSINPDLSCRVGLTRKQTKHDGRATSLVSDFKIGSQPIWDLMVWQLIKNAFAVWFMKAFNARVLAPSQILCNILQKCLLFKKKSGTMFKGEDREKSVATPQIRESPARKENLSYVDHQNPKNLCSWNFTLFSMHRVNQIQI